MKRIFFIAALSIAMTACDNNDDYADEPVAAEISATIGKSDDTRASDSSWEVGDMIGVTMGDRYANIKYTAESEDGLFTGTTTMYFKNKKDPVNLTAYYPFSGTEGTTCGLLEASTESEVQTAEAQPKFDFLFAEEKGMTGAEPTVKFRFDHMMSKLTLIFKNGSGCDVGKITSYEISGLKLEGTFNPATGECVAKSDAEAAGLGFTVAEGTVKHEEALPPLILFPQTIGKDAVTLRITDSEGQSYACFLNAGDNSLKSGENYTYTITVNKPGLVVGSSSINNWNDNNIEGDASSE